MDGAAGIIRDLGFSPKSNITKIGEALVHVFEIQHQIYKIHPELQPPYLRDE